MKTRRILSVLLAVFLLVSLMPTALAEESTASTAATVYDTYLFYNDESDTEPVQTQYIINGEFLAEPTIPNGSGEFLGWYAGEEKVDFDTPVSSVTGKTIYVYPRFADTVYVTFYDADGTTVAAVKKVENGSVNTSDVSVEPENVGEAFDGWKNSADQKVGDTYTTATNASLFPVFTAANKLTFDANANDATATAPQYVKEGNTTTKPADPQRPGYTFDGWYTAAEGGNKFTFGSPLSENTTVYAHWTPASAKYTVVIWQQKVTDDKDAADEKKTYDYFKSEERSATTGTRVNATDTDKDYNYTGFHFGRADTNVEVQSDGSTILNVYYDRDVISLTFNPNNDNYYILVQNGGEYDSASIITYNGQTYAHSVTYRGLYGSEIYFTWPSSYLSKSNQNKYSSTSCRWRYKNPNSTSESGYTNTTFLADFILPTGGTSIEYTPNTDKTSKTVSFYRQNVDGNWPDSAETTVNASGAWNITDKYTGFTAYQYKINSNGTWTSVGVWDPQNNRYGDQIGTNNYTNLYIRYTRNTYTIDFMNGSEKVDSAPLLYGAALNTVAAPSGENLTYPGAAGDAATHYTFLGWYTAPTGGEKVDFNTITETMPANNLVFYAHWEADTVTVTYNANGGTSAKQTESVNYNEKAQGATATWDGHLFLGWVDEAGNPYDFDTPVTDNITLTAKWRSESELKVAYKTSEYGDAVPENEAYIDGAQAIVKISSEPDFIGWRLGNTVYYPGDVIDVDSHNDALDGSGDGIVTLTAEYRSAFEIVHSVTNNKETVAMKSVSGNSFDITERVGLDSEEAYLYGGYYSEGPTADGTWDGTKAIIEAPGSAMAPTNKATYYLKEVHTDYLRPKNLAVYDNNSENKNLRRLYLITAIDDLNYKTVGFDVVDSASLDEEVSEGTVYQSVTIRWKNDAKQAQTKYLSDFFDKATYAGISSDTGYVSVQSYIQKEMFTCNFSFTPYFITLDGVKVTGTETRQVESRTGYLSGLYQNNIAVVSNTETDGSAVAAPMMLSFVSTYNILWDDDTEDVSADTPEEPDENVEPEELPEDDLITEPAAPVVTEYTITKVDGRNTVDTQTVEAGNQTGNITYPEKRGYVFAGWFADSKLKTPADFSNVQGDLTVYAKYISERTVKASATVKYTGKNRNISASASASVTLDGSAYAEVGFTYEVNGETVRVTAASNGRDKRTFTAEWSLDGLENQKNVTVTPYWVTLDGTVVNGPATVLRLSSNTNVRR